MMYLASGKYIPNQPNWHEPSKWNRLTFSVLTYIYLFIYLFILSLYSMRVRGLKRDIISALEYRYKRTGISDVGCWWVQKGRWRWARCDDTMIWVIWGGEHEYVLMIVGAITAWAIIVVILQNGRIYFRELYGFNAFFKIGKVAEDLSSSCNSFQ